MIHYLTLDRVRVTSTFNSDATRLDTTPDRDDNHEPADDNTSENNSESNSEMLGRENLQPLRLMRRPPRQVRRGAALP